jgi:hypothetical protein
MLSLLLVHSSIQLADAAFELAPAISSLGMETLRETRSEIGDTMTEDRNMAANADPSRHLNRARAALREAAEHLEDAAAASEHPSVTIASAISHVGSARKAIRPYGLIENEEALEANAA